MTFPFFAGSPIKQGDIPPAVHAFSNTQQTDLTNTAFAPGSPEVGVSFIAPPGGYVLGIVGGGIRDNGGTNRGSLAIEIYENDSSGAVVQDAQVRRNAWTNNSFNINSSVAGFGSRVAPAPINDSSLLTPLVPGATYFARVMQAVSGGTTVDIIHRDITIVPLPLGAATGSRLVSNLDNVRTLGGGTQVSIFNVSNSHGDWQAPSTNARLRFIAPSSGRALIIVAGGLRDNTNTNRIGMAPEVREDDENGRKIFDLNAAGIRDRYMWTNHGNTNGSYLFGCRVGWLQDLEPGRQYFAQTMLAATTTTSNSADAFNQRLIVVGVS